MGKEPEPEKKERVGLWATFKLNMQIFSAATVAAASTWVRVIYYHGSWVDFSSEQWSGGQQQQWYIAGP